MRSLELQLLFSPLEQLHRSTCFLSQLSLIPYAHTHRPSSLRGHPTHIISNPIIIQQPLNTADRRDSNILIPQPLLCKRHHILLSDAADNTLDLRGIHASTGCDNLTAHIFSDGGCAVERKQNGGLELSFGALDFGFGDIDGEAGPFAQGEVDEIVNLGFVFRDEVDTPETEMVSILGVMCESVTYPVSE